MSGKETVQNRVSSVFCAWLRTEALTPSAEHDKLLGDYSAARQNLRLPFAEAGAITARRLSRYEQFKQDMALLPEVATDTDTHAERFRGSIIHQALGMVADGFRLQCLLEAPTGEAYVRRLRYEGRTAGVDIPGLVYHAFSNAGDHGLQGESAAGHFAEYGDRLNEQIVDAYVDAYDDTVHEGVGLTDHAPTVRAARDVQKAGIRLAASSVIMQAHLNEGNYAAIPFITPQPDAIASTYYPLAA
jgi:hypothetical protein